MNTLSMRKIFLVIALVFSIVVTTYLPNAYAENINVKATALEETTIIELTNDSKEEVSTFRIWLGSDFSFKSFKTEKGWVGEKTPQGVIIFTSSEKIELGESVKFGVKTNKAIPGINWKALNKEGIQIEIGKTIPSIIQTNPKRESTNGSIGASISSESTFRIIPENPNVGSPIRVTGDKFGASQEFDFYINAEKLGSFLTDEDGHFITTMKIPENQEAGRVDFRITDKEGNEKKFSIRIDKIKDRIIESDIKLTVQGIPNVVNRGDFLEIFGTGNPNSAITIKINSPDGNIINSKIASVDAKGDWKLEEPVIIAQDAPLGKYNSTISDGRESIEKDWTVESDKVIIIAPTSLKFELGETMKFNGTALPNKPIEMILEDPLGNEIFSNIIQTGDSGYVEFEFPTSHNTAQGTYTLIATQGKEKEIIYSGVGQLPIIPVNMEFDKLNYKASETALISLTGQASDIISLLIIDPSDKPVGDPISIQLLPDGRGKYSLELEGYSSGIYTAVVIKGSAQSQETFTVGLQTGSGEITINTTKINYNPGDQILILGDTSPNVLLTLSMIDPQGNEIKSRETFSDKDGKITESSFRIPSDAKTGSWTIKARSGSNFAIDKINVLGSSQDGMKVVVTDRPKLDGVNDFINIHVLGAKQTVKIEIFAEDGKVIESMEFPSSQAGEVNQPWKIPKDMEPGTYTVKVSDAFSSAETTFEI